MTINHHPHDDLLLSYAAGSLSETWSLAVASHLSLCPECRRTLELAETIGGILFADMPDERMSSDALDHVLAQIDQPSGEAASANTQLALDKHAAVSTTFPRVLCEYVGHDVDDVPWRDELFTNKPIIRNGCFELSSEPGWGTDLNESALEKYKWQK